MSKGQIGNILRVENRYLGWKTENNTFLYMMKYFIDNLLFSTLKLGEKATIFRMVEINFFFQFNFY